MWLNPFPDIWREDPARIPVPGDARAALARVSARTPRWTLLAWWRETCVGRVDGDRVRLRRYRPYRRSGSNIVLDAELHRDVPVSELIGVYREHRAGRAFSTFWFAFVLLMIPLSSAAAIASWSDDPMNAIPLLVVPVILFLAGRAILAWQSRRWDEDKMFIERFLADCFAEASK